tara:strand:- start:514 stop:1752 length:1239 start_codon:yes stop_codon:yes gene_type:complete
MVLVVTFFSLLVVSWDAFPQSFVVTNARVFDGKMVYTNMDVVVRDGRIASLGSSSISEDIPHINAVGETLLPGLIDAHTHTQEIGQLEESLRFGITTVLDMGTFPPYEIPLREAAATRTDVADFRSAGILATAPGGHGTEFGIEIPTVAGVEEAVDFVRKRSQENVDYLKIVMNGVRAARSGMPTLGEDTVRALVNSGHEAGLMVLAHVESQGDVRLAISAGVDGLVHHWRDSGAQPELAGLLAANNVFVMPTLTAIDGLLGLGPQALLQDERVVPYLSDLAYRELTKELPTPPPGISITIANQATTSLIRAGVQLLAGSDAFTGNPRIVHGASLHRLLELFVDAGLSPTEALRTATSNVAEAFGLSDRGRIQPGFRADLVLVRGDPTEDITVTRDILRVWKAGVELQRQSF